MIDKDGFWHSKHGNTTGGGLGALIEDFTGGGYAKDIVMTYFMSTGMPLRVVKFRSAWPIDFYKADLSYDKNEIQKVEITFACDFIEENYIGQELLDFGNSKVVDMFKQPVTAGTTAPVLPITGQKPGVPVESMAAAPKAAPIPANVVTEETRRAAVVAATSGLPKPVPIPPITQPGSQAGFMRVPVAPAPTSTVPALRAGLISNAGLSVGAANRLAVPLRSPIFMSTALVF